MSVREFKVSLNPIEAMQKIHEGVSGGSISGTLVDHYERSSGDHQVVVFVVEKYFIRTSNRSSMTVTIDNFDGTTRVHAVASGSSESVFFRFDWGAGNSFANSVEKALAEYHIS
jgi:hypothetical protein